MPGTAVKASEVIQLTIVCHLLIGRGVMVALWHSRGLLIEVLCNQCIGSDLHPMSRIVKAFSLPWCIKLGPNYWGIDL